MIFAIYFLYTQNQSLKSRYHHDTKQTKVIKKLDKNISTKKTIKPKIIKVITVKKIDEDKILNKNSFKTLMILEKKKPTFQTALDLAKYYFKQKDFEKSAKWAVVASNREPNEEEAWLLYAKSKIKLHKKGMAKKALKIYLLKYHSQKVTNLLNSL